MSRTIKQVDFEQVVKGKKRKAVRQLTQMTPETELAILGKFVTAAKSMKLLPRLKFCTRIFFRMK